MCRAELDTDKTANKTKTRWGGTSNRGLIVIKIWIGIYKLNKRVLVNIRTKSVAISSMKNWNF